MSLSGYPDSYYVASAIGIKDRPELTENIQADVCVIGGGFTGMSAAVNLAEKGYKVVVLEAERVGFGASGRCGGLIGSGQRKDVLEMEETFGYALSRQFWDFAEEAKQEIRDRVAKHQIQCDLQRGQLVGIHKKSYLGWAQELSEALADRYDYPNTRSLSAEETRELVNTPTFLEGFLDEDAAHLHPLNFNLGLARAAEELGVQIYENSRVQSYTHTDPALVSTARGTVKASFVVLGCNGYLGKLEKRVAGKIMPINNFMIATEPLGEERARSVISRRVGVHDSRFVVDYFRMSDDHRLLFGGGENYRPSFPRDILNFVRPYMLKLFPQLEDVKVEYAWGGTLSVTVNRLPHLGRLAPNLYYGQGYSGHGISTAIFAGKVIAEAVSGTAEKLDVFGKLPIHTFPGGTLLRYPGMVLGMLFFSLKDKL